MSISFVDTPLEAAHRCCRCSISACIIAHSQPCGAHGCRRSETRADSGKNLARLRAEQAWTALHLEHGLPLHIFRLGGESVASAFMCEGLYRVYNPQT